MLNMLTSAAKRGPQDWKSRIFNRRRDLTLPERDLVTREEGSPISDMTNGDKFCESDLLTSRIDIVLFETTTNCNLRCTYCGVSSPSYIGSDFDLSRISDVVSSMVSANVRNVQISGHGETTIIPNWHVHCREFQDAGIGVSITSNFATVFSEAEVDALARMSSITISIDTVDRDLLKAVRRKVDLRTILYNMQLIRLGSLRIGGREPTFNWQCTLTDVVVSGLKEWVQMGLLTNVKSFTLGNFLEHNGLSEVLERERALIPRHVAHLDAQSLAEACASISEAVSLARSKGASVVVQPGIVEGINARLGALGVNAPFSV